MVAASMTSRAIQKHETRHGAGNRPAEGKTVSQEVGCCEKRPATVRWPGPDALLPRMQIYRALGGGWSAK
jgi:hypothetical protein